MFIPSQVCYQVLVGVIRQLLSLITVPFKGLITW